MKYIDLRKEYPHLDATYSEYPVSCKIDAMFEQCRLAEQALEKRRSRNGDVVSLDSEPGVEAHILERVPGPEEEAMKHIQNKELYKALRSIPRKQADRIYAYYFMDMTLEEIAAGDGTSVQAVYYSIQAGKKNLKKILDSVYRRNVVQ